MANRLTRIKALLVKAETTKGTDAVPTGASNALLLRNVEMEPLGGQLVDRQLIRSYLGGYQQIQVETLCRITGKFDLMTSGAAGTPPDWGVLLKGAGFSETIVASTSVTYAPVSTAFTSLTGYFLQGSDSGNALRHILLGGYVESLTLSLSGRALPEVDFAIVGVKGTISDQSMPSQTLTTQIPIVPTTTNTPTISLHSYTPALASLAINVRNQIAHPAIVNQDEFIFTERMIDGQAVIKTPLIAEKDYFTIAQNVTMGALNIVHGVGAGKILTLSSSSVQLVQPTYGDLDGVSTLQMALRFVPTATGNDDISIVMT